MSRVTLEDEMRKNSKLCHGDLQILKDWMVGQPHLPQITDMTLVLFLHACDYDIENAKTTIDKYYTFRTKAPNLWTNRIIRGQEFQNCAKVLGTAILDGRDVDGNLVLIQRLIDTDATKYNIEACIKLSLAVIEVYQLELGTVPGLTLLYDQKGYGLGHITRAPLSEIKNITYFVQECAPINVMSIQVINTNIVTASIIAVFKPFMSTSLRSKIRTHREEEQANLYEIIPREILPREYGGDAPSLMELTEITIKKLEDYQSYFDEEESKRSDESKRIENG